jgi:hypothetical protein
MAYDLDNPNTDLDTATTDPDGTAAADDTGDEPGTGRSRPSPSARAIAGWPVVGALVLATAGFVIAVIAGAGDGGADHPAPAPDPVTQEDVSGSDRHLENQADEIAERVREGGIPVPTTAADRTAGADPTAVADSTAAADDTGDEMVCSGDPTGGGTVCRM